MRTCGNCPGVYTYLRPCKSAVCVKDQIAKVCIRAPGPETEVCAKPYKRRPIIWASSIRFAVVTPKYSYVPWGGPLGSRGGGTLGKPLGDPLGDVCGTLEGPLGDPMRTLGGPLGDPCLGGTLGAHPCGTLGGPLEDPWRTLGGSLEDPWWTLGGPWEELRTLPPQTSGLPRCVYTYLGLNARYE